MAGPGSLAVSSMYGTGQELEAAVERMLDGLGLRWTKADDNGPVMRTVTYKWQTEGGFQ